MRHSPFNLVHGSEVVIPMEVSIPHLEWHSMSSTRMKRRNLLTWTCCRESGEHVAKVHMVQTTDHSAVQPSSQNQINPARQLGGSGSQGYKTLTSQGEVNTKLWWSLKSKRNSQSRHIPTGIPGKCTPGPTLECIQPKKIIYVVIVTCYRGIYVIAEKWFIANSTPLVTSQAARLNCR